MSHLPILTRDQLAWHLSQAFHRGVPFKLAWVALSREPEHRYYHGLDFSGQEAIQYDFYERGFWYCSFAGGTFDGSEFDGSDLYHAELREGSFIAATFTGACLDHIDATGANLSFARLTVLSANDAIFRHATLYKAQVGGIFLSACFEGANLREANFALSDLRYANFRHADCTGAIFTKADLSGADMTGAILVGVNLEEASHQPAYLRREWRGDEWVRRFTPPVVVDGPPDEEPFLPEPPPLPPPIAGEPSPGVSYGDPFLPDFPDDLY